MMSSNLFLQLSSSSIPKVYVCTYVHTYILHSSVSHIYKSQTAFELYEIIEAEQQQQLLLHRVSLTVCVLILFDKLLPWRNVRAIMNPGLSFGADAENLVLVAVCLRSCSSITEQNDVHWILFGGFRTKASPEKCSAKWEGTCCAQWFFWAKRAPTLPSPRSKSAC